MTKQHNPLITPLLDHNRAHLIHIFDQYNCKSFHILTSLIGVTGGICGEVRFLIEPSEASTPFSVGELEQVLETHLGVTVDVLTIEDIPACSLNRVLRESMEI